MGAGRVRMGRGMTDEQIAKLTLPELISTTQSTKAPSGALFSMEGNNMTIITNATNTIIDLSDIQFSHLYWLFLLPAIFAAADIITGWLQATINSCWDSTKMRKGLYRKGGEMLVVFRAYIIYIANSYRDCQGNSHLHRDYGDRLRN